MNFEEVQEFVLDRVKLITFSSKALKEAVNRATTFLEAMAIITDYKMELENEKAKLTTWQEGEFSKAIKGSEGKNVTEKKIDAVSSKEYTKVREKVEEIDAAISWCKSYIRIFENAHLIYRQQARLD